MGTLGASNLPVRGLDATRADSLECWRRMLRRSRGPDRDILVEPTLEHLPVDESPIHGAMRPRASAVTLVAGRRPPGPTLGALRHRCVDEGAVASTRVSRGRRSGLMGLWLGQVGWLVAVMAVTRTTFDLRRAAFRTAAGRTRTGSAKGSCARSGVLIEDPGAFVVATIIPYRGGGDR